MIAVEKLCCLVRSSSDETLPECDEGYMEGGHFIARMVEKASDVAKGILNVTSKLEAAKAVYSRYMNQEGIVDVQSFTVENQEALLADLNDIDEQINDLNRSMRWISVEYTCAARVHCSNDLSLAVQSFVSAMEENDKNLRALSQNMEQFRSKVNGAIPFYRSWCVIL